MPSLLIKNANIIASDKDYFGAFLGIQDGYFNYVNEAPPAHAYDETFDAQDAIICPAFVNAHTHSPMTLFRNLADDVDLHAWLFDGIFSAENQLTKDDVIAGTKNAIIEMLASGTTLFNDMYFSNPLSIVDVIKSSKIRAVFGGGLASFDKENFENLKIVLDYNELLKSGNKKLKISVSPHAIYTSSPEFLKYLADVYSNNNYLFHIHLAETKKEYDDCLNAHGKTPTRLLYDLGFFKSKTIIAHGIYLNDEDIDIIKENNVSIAHCPVSNAKLGSGIAPIEKYIEKGINVCLGTDGAASNNSLNMLNELRFAALIHKASNCNPKLISAKQALKMATINGAKALDYDNLGEIKIGNLADFIIFETNSSNMRTPKIDNPDLSSIIVYSAESNNITNLAISGEFI